jgi:hypothetical protein
MQAYTTSFNIDYFEFYIKIAFRFLYIVFPIEKGMFSVGGGERRVQGFGGEN